MTSFLTDRQISEALLRFQQQLAAMKWDRDLRAAWLMEDAEGMVTIERKFVPPDCFHYEAPRRWTVPIPQAPRIESFPATALLDDFRRPVQEFELAGQITCCPKAFNGVCNVAYFVEVRRG